MRPARSEDEDAVAALSAHIWEGDDYVPRRFAEWTNDPHGQFTLVWDGDRLVGFGKLSRLREGQWWLEGLRVHPEDRGRGVARRLHEHAVRLADEIADGVLRFATGSGNVAVHKLARASGFQFVAAYCLAQAPAHAAQSAKGRFVTLGKDELADVRLWLSRSPQADAWAGLYEERWKWLALQPDLELLLKEERLYWWRDEASANQGLVVMQGNDEVLWVDYLAADAATLRHIGSDLKLRARQAGLERVRVKPPAVPAFRTMLQESGWEIETEFEMWVFERPLGKTHQS